MANTAITLAVSVSAILFSVQIALARTPLDQDARITHALTQAALAKKITDECPNARPRMMVALTKALALKSYAKELGHSDDEIDAFIGDKNQEQRIISEARAYLAAKGISESAPAAVFCQLAKDEINAGSLAGEIMNLR